MNNQPDFRIGGRDGQISLPPDLSSLLSVCLASAGEGDEANLQILASLPLDQIRQQGLTPWIYYWGKFKGFEDRLPTEVLQSLRQDFSQQLLRTSVQENEIQEILAALADAGIDFILLKGADLSRRVYADPVLRAMSDLDLLLAREVIPLAELVLQKLGYRIYAGHRDKRLIVNEVLYTPPKGKILYVDLHWEIVAACSFYYIPYLPLKGQAVSSNYCSIPALVLSPEHLLIHLCLHAFENFPVLSQLLDLALVVLRLPLDWHKVLQEASRFDCQLPVYLMLREIARVIPGKVPVAALAQLGARSPSLIEEMVLRPRLRYLTLALPFFYRHRSLRQWFSFIGANIWPNQEVLETSSGHSQASNLRNLLRKFLSKLTAPES